MSSETISTKRRGRPKKVVEIESVVIDDGEGSEPLPKKKSTRTRKTIATSTDEISLASKPVKRKKSSVPEISSESLAENIETNASKHERKGIDQSSGGFILRNATAFDKIKASVTSLPQADEISGDKSIKTNKTEESIEETQTLHVQSPEQAVATSSNMFSEKPQLNTSKTFAIDEQVTQAVPASGSERSAFLSSFLDAPEETPVVAEENKFSDRSAMKGERPSIEAIVSGSGVSTHVDSMNIEAKKLDEQSTSHSTTTLPKSFKPLTISAFEHSQTKASAITPETYSTSSFLSLKSTPALSSPVQKQHQIPQTTFSNHQTRKPELQSGASSARSVTQPVANRPRPASHPQQIHNESSGTGTQRARPVLRPTEMSYEQVTALPEYRKLKWTWTARIVAIPILIVTSWALYKRYNETQAARTTEQKRLRGQPVGMGVERGNVSNGGV